MIILERARSGRSRCRRYSCRLLISYDEWRVRIGRAHYHIGCFMSLGGTSFLRGLIPILTDDQLRSVGLEVEHIGTEPDDSVMMPDPEPSRPFAVGDRVRVRADRVGTECEFGGEYTGQWEGEVRNIGNESEITVYFDVGSTNHWCVNLDAVEHIPPPTPEPAPEPESDPDPEWWRSLEPGDMVRVTDVTTHSSRFSMGPFTVGEELEVLMVKGSEASAIRIRRNDNGDSWWIFQDSVERV